MGMDQVERIDRLPPDLGVEVETAGRETSTFQQFVKHQRKLGHIHRELIGIPAEQIIAAVDVERAQDSQGLGKRELLLERMAGENGVVLLDVELDVFQKIVALKEAIAGGNVEIVLVLGRLLGLGLDQDRPLETDSVLVLDHQRDK